MNELKAYKKSEEEIRIEIIETYRNIELNWWKNVQKISLIYIVLAFILTILLFFFAADLSFKPTIEFFGPLSSTGFLLGIIAVGFAGLAIFGTIFVLVTYLMYVFFIRIKASKLSISFINNSSF